MELLKLADWLRHHGITYVAMESTGVYWKPVFNVLEDTYEVMVVNAKHIRFVPGRKTMSKMPSGSPNCCSMGCSKAVLSLKRRSVTCVNGSATAYLSLRPGH